MKSIDFNTFYKSNNYSKNLEKLFSDYRLFKEKYFSKKCLNHFQKNYPNSELLLTHSATGALEIAALALDLKEGDEVIMPSYTFVSTANAFAREGAKIIFVDIEEETLGLDPKLVEKAVSPKTKAVVAVHYAGHSCKLNEIKEICKKNKLFLIEDASLCYGNHQLGTHGDFGILSFDITKHISATQGGLLLINNKEYVEKCKNIYHIGTNRESFQKGEKPYYEWVSVGSKYQMPETNAAILFEQLQHEKEILEKLSQISRWYYEKMHLFFTTIEEGNLENNFHEFYIITQSQKQRDETIHTLQENNIQAYFHYIPLHSSMFGKSNFEYISERDITTNISETLVRLPFHTELEKEDIDFILENVVKTFDNA